MQKITLGSTGIVTSKNGFGALPIQRVDFEYAGILLKKALDNGINFIDTARFYTDSEEKIGYTHGDVRDQIFLATKTMAQNGDKLKEELNISLDLLKTDYIDVYQFHNPKFCPLPGDGTGLYEAALEAKGKGQIRHIGITNHRIAVAVEAAESGLYETIQFPFSYLATKEEEALVKLCAQRNIGFIAMKAMAGGLASSSAAAYAFLAQYDNVLPIWGVQREEELDEFISYAEDPPVLDESLTAIIEADREELSSEFCRSCGYCLPCPVDIDIPNAARMSLMLRRAPLSVYLNEEWQAKMKQVEECIECNHCKEHCPYHLDTPRLLKDNLADYKTFLE